MMGQVTEREVLIYREIYYETVKPMIRAGRSDHDIEAGIDYMCQEFDIPTKRYKLISKFDMLQRIAELMQKYDNVYILGNRDMNKLLNIPKIRCPKRTEQQE